MANPVEQKLYDAIRYGRVGEALSLLKNNPVINVNWKNPDHSQWSGLHAASFYGHAEVVKLLLAHPNIDVNMKNISGQTPFSIGCWQGRVTVVRVLLKDPRVDISLDDNDGRTPLWHASRNGEHEVIKWFIASGRDLGDIKNKKWEDWFGKDYTALEIAREGNKTEAVSLLERFIANQHRPVMKFV